MQKALWEVNINIQMNESTNEKLIENCDYFLYCKKIVSHLNENVHQTFRI